MASHFDHGYAKNERDEPNDLAMDDEEQEYPKADLDEPGSKIWCPYLELSDKLDKDLVLNWRDDMDLLLIFSALFSASVTAFVIESYKTLSQDSGDVTISVLLQISQQLANITHAPVAVRPPFHTDPRYTSVNIFWFMSLAFSLTCALAAVLVKQWARQYLRFPRSFTSTSERARARQYVFENMQWWKMEVIVETIPVLLHISLLLFFTGLLLFLRIINDAVAIFLFCFSGTGTLVYMWLTIAPLIFPGCPYKTPFSGFLRFTFKPFLRLIIWLTPSHYTRTCARIYAAELYYPIRRALHPLADRGRRLVVRVYLSFYLALGAPHPDIRVPPVLLRSWRKFQAFAVLPWKSALNNVSRRIQATLRGFSERRGMFCDELTPRDTRALSWVMDYSKRDTDMYTIIAAVPDFFQSNGSVSGFLDVHSVMWNCGITARTIQLLRSSTIATNHDLGVSLLETTIWLTRSSTEILASGVKLDIDVMMELAYICSGEVNMGNNSDLEQIYWLVLSNIVLHLIYKLENEWMHDGSGNLGQIGLSRSARDVVDTVVVLTNSLTTKMPKGPKDYEIRQLLDALEHFAWDELLDPASAWHIRKTLKAFRSELAMNMLGTQLAFAFLPSLHQKLALPSMSDMTTHLQHYPLSSCDTQAAVFTLFNDLLANTEHKGKPRPTENDLSMVFSAYGFVLFGSEFKLDKLNRQTLHADFIDRINIFEGPNKGGHKRNRVDITVNIHFSRYCKILDEWLPALKASLSPHSASPLNNEWVWDLQAEIIRIFLKYRMNDYEIQVDESCNNPIVVDNTHIANVREIQAILRDIKTLNGISFLITRMAQQFGYHLQLRPTYHLDTHAELQHYDLDGGRDIFS